MTNNFQLWKTNRAIYAKFLQHNTLEQLNMIPEGFNNNLIWNIGHVIAVQQRLVYGLSGLQMNITDELFQKYKPGTIPNHDEPVETVELFKELLSSTIDQTIADFEAGEFNDYTEYTTSKGFHLSSAEDAIAFNNYHEALHLGTMVSILKFIH
ncbi:DinB family protein [Algoriphagus ratkowskyi]|uniref:DinB family protein n=1 Tax=Algoriphagus ratkowskyi TaxID=57028 RepID=A0A2W7R6I4_9BACT|nr:DinB family protein [Algoriphagus ratkowskyi]PZX56074.1 DinB family protein [Algoriphagus ratkowskyi]TXD77121.1 DinB family protein [Algoriphagus ratkowskyi]